MVKCASDNEVLKHAPGTLHHAGHPTQWLTHSKKPPARNEVMSRSGAYSQCDRQVKSRFGTELRILQREAKRYFSGKKYTNADTCLDKAPGQEAFSTVLKRCQSPSIQSCLGCFKASCSHFTA